MCVCVCERAVCPQNPFCFHLQVNINNTFCHQGMFVMSRGEGSSVPLPPLSWERPQGSISQPAITRSQNGSGPPHTRAVGAVFNAIHRLLNRDALGRGCSPRHKDTGSNRQTCFCLMVIVVIFVQSIISGCGPSPQTLVEQLPLGHTNNAIAD